MTPEYLEQKAREIRRAIVDMVGKAGSGHPGGSLSAADIMSVLYFDEMKVDPENPNWEERDYFVLSKGHAAPAQYAALSLRGYFPVAELDTLRKLGSHLQGHPAKGKVPGVEISTGSLGQGIAAACGLAKAFKMDGKENRVYALLGDGETQEGQVWEAAMFAAHYKLDNLVAIIDHNTLQIDGRITSVMSPEPLDQKFEAFGWHVIVVDGHNIQQLQMAFANARIVQGKPVMILANTVKGKGVSFMEDNASWHGNAPKGDDLINALTELA